MTQHEQDPVLAEVPEGWHLESLHKSSVRRYSVKFGPEVPPIYEAVLFGPHTADGVVGHGATPIAAVRDAARKAKA